MARWITEFSPELDINCDSVAWVPKNCLLLPNCEMFLISSSVNASGASEFLIESVSLLPFCAPNSGAKAIRPAMVFSFVFDSSFYSNVAE